MKRLLPLFPGLVCVFMLLAFASDASAQGYPRTISVQGYLEDPVTGFPVSDAKCALIIRIYDDSTGNNKLYESPEIEALLYKGIFNVEIGPLDSVFTDSITGPGYTQREYYVGIIVENGPELTPRTKLTAVPYALSVDPKAAVTKLEFKGVDTTTMSGYVVIEAGEGISFAPGTGPNSVKISAVVDAILTDSVLDAKTWRLGGNTNPDTNIFGTLDATTINMQTNGSSAIIIDGTTQDVNILKNLDVDGNTTHVGTLDQQGSVSNSTGDVVINDDANVTGSLDVDGNVKVAGLLSLPNLSPNSVVVTDGSSNIAVETIDNLFSGSTLSEHALLVGDAANNPVELAVGVVDQVLQVSASGTPQWQTINLLSTGTVNNSMLVWDNTLVEWVENTMLIADPVTGNLDIVGTTTLNTYSGGGNQSLYVDNTGTIQASNATAAQNATGIFGGKQAVVAGGFSQAVAESNVVAGSVIQVTIESVGGPANYFYINGITPGVGFTVNFATPTVAGDVIHYTVSNP